MNIGYLTRELHIHQTTSVRENSQYVGKLRI